jgi:GT2 family glycosyltransferase
MLDLSVIIVNYNTKKLLVDCINSVISEGSSLKKEIIVIDNGSSDSSQTAVQKFQIKLIENKENLGFARANNQGLKIAKGKYKLLLNSDTKVKKDSLGEMVKFARSKKDAGVVGPKLLNADGSIQASCYNFPTIWRAVEHFWFGRTGYWEKYAPRSKKPITVEAIVGAAFLITPTALKKVGLLDERYFMFFEDLDYCRSVWKKGLKVYYLPRVEVIHHHEASGKHLADPLNQWRRGVVSSKIYHGPFEFPVYSFILWSGQKWQNLKKSLR